MFPLIPLLALASILGGAWTLKWYYGLSQEERTRADRLANDYAILLFNNTLDQLTAAEAKRVHALVRNHFPN